MTRRGFTIWETVLALTVLAVLTSVCLQFFMTAGDQRQQILVQLTAAQEAANLLERMEVLEWDELTPPSAAKVQLSAQARQVLPEGRAEITIDEPSGTPPAKRVTASVCWRPQPGGPERKVRLVAWRYKKP